MKASASAGRNDRKMNQKTFARLSCLLLGILMIPLCFGCQKVQAPEAEELVRVYVAHNERQYLAAIKEFQERTGIRVEVWAAGTGDCLERIAQEAEDPYCDVMWGGTVESLIAYESCFQPYISSEDVHILEQFKDPNHLWIGESQQPAVIMYNKRLVSEREVPRSWKDLLDAKWKGQIASADPASSGSAYTLLCNMILAASQGEDREAGWAFIEALMENLVISGSSSSVYSGVANGEFALGLTLEQLARPYVLSDPEGVGMIYPVDGSSNVPDGVALVRDCPHEENARLLIDFLLSADCQQYMSDVFDRRSVRDDIVKPRQLPDLDSIYFIDYDYVWAGTGKEDVLARWQEILGRNP